MVLCCLFLVSFSVMSLSIVYADNEKTCFRGFRHKPGCKAIENGQSLEFSDIGCSDIVLSTLISCAVSAQLICALVFAYAKKRFSHDAAHIGSVILR